MFEDSVSSVPSIWTLVSSWFTPSVLFVFLNLVIGTIFFTSNRKQQNPQNPDQQQQQQPTKFGRSPSVLNHLKSFKLYLHYPSPESQTHYQHPPSSAVGNRESQDPPPSETRHESQDPHSEEDTTARELEEEFDRVEEFDSVLEPQIPVARTMSDAAPASGLMPEKLPTKLRKSASTLSAFSHFEEDEIVEARRPATVREGKVTEGDEEVDAKADDFIVKFRQQLKLQRLDSILRYKETIVRGTGM